AAGIAYFGNLYGTNEQVWFSNSMLRQHCAFLATTGSGKTFTITSMASGNALIWGAGYAYIDAKADLDIIRMHQSMMWRTNRIDDLFILNYIRGARDRYAYASDRTTNTYNLLETGSASQNTETMKSLMDGDGDI
ncbi:MAG: ATP-binding protein, partial [Vibrio sp.]|nr:ATP-binding protein [Vibrio sp.]